jgi:hypothetical protein
MASNLEGSDHREEAWIEKYRAVAELNNAPPAQSAFKKFCQILIGARAGALAKVDKILDQLVRVYRPGQTGSESSEASAPPPPPAEPHMLAEGMERVELLRQNSPKKTTAARTRSHPGPRKHRRHIA